MASSKKFLNDNGARCVQEMLDGLVAAHPQQLRKLNGEDVIVRADFEQSREREVALISGGGSGHEPAHAGFCGAGMLTAAVCGGVFASPSMQAVLHTIRTVAGPKGCLLIVKNYTGDRLNFGLAAEEAKAEGIPVETVFVGDDAALSGKGVTGRRGLAGTALVHKVAGAAAASGASLEEVRAAAEAVCERVRTVGAALSLCNVPGKKLGDRLQADDGKMELGLGIHGEPGRETLDVLSTDALVARFAEMMLSDFTDTIGHRPRKVAVLLNNLGGTTPLEMYGICDALLRILRSAPFELEVVRLYSGPVMTSLEMQGVSLSLLALDAPGTDMPLLLDRLDAGTAAIGWPGLFASFRGEAERPAPVLVRPAPATADGEQETANALSEEVAGRLEARMRAAAKALVDNEPKLTEWDRLCGDGDAGETFAKGANLVVAALDAHSVPLRSPVRTMAALAKEARQMGGTSGAVLSIFFTACEGQLRKDAALGAALRAGCAAITKYGGATPGMRTMLDALQPAAEQWGVEPDLQAAAKAALDGAEATADMNASAGRSNYVPDEKLRGVPDPGAMAVAYVFQALAGTSQS